MAEQTFKSPGFFEREIEVISRPLVVNRETPAGIVGPAEKGPAFVPVTVSSADEYFRIFGTPDRYRYSGHAVSEYFREKPSGAVTFCRVLGSGNSDAQALAPKAGFKLSGTDIGNSRATGAVYFISAVHTLNDAEHITLGLFNDNDSHTTDMATDDIAAGGANAADFAADKKIQLVRAMIFMHKDYTLKISAHTDTTLPVDTNADFVAASSGKFKLWIENRVDASLTLERTVSLNPSDSDYVTKVLNTDMFGLDSHGHVLYADFPVDDEIASAAFGDTAVTRGNDLDLFGDFSSRYTTPETPYFISQPFGKTEYDLFKVEALDDGAYASSKYKLSIVNLRASVDPTSEYGSFGLQLRDLNDTDDNPVIYESYSNLSLDPNANNFVARVIGDQRLRLSLDVDSEDEKRLVREGSFPNRSSRVRVVVSDPLLRGEVPPSALPFGFRGIPALKTTSGGTDAADTHLLIGNSVATGANEPGSSVLPPLPYRFKVTKGDMQRSKAWFQTYLGETSTNGESTRIALYWGLVTTRIPSITQPNSATAAQKSNLVASLCKYLGNNGFANTKDGAAADKFNNNKFSLAKVAFAVDDVDDLSSVMTDAFKEAVYVRNADPDTLKYDVINHKIDMSLTRDFFSDDDGVHRYRATYAQLLLKDKIKFNKFSVMAKFTAPFYGGFDGVNILDKEDYYFTDRASSTSAGGHANPAGYSSGLSGTDDGADLMQGDELENNIIVSYRNAIKVMTDEMVVNSNVLLVPGIREPLITDYAASRVRNYGKAIYLMDIEHYDKSGDRIFTSPFGTSSGRPDVENTSNRFLSREPNSSYVATYFPDVVMSDAGDLVAGGEKRNIVAPSSVVALGALARTDALGTPWFAPAGFNRGSLSNVNSLAVRLNSGDRDTLYEARINPIANFPNNQFVIFGQKTTQVERTALDRVNVRRLMIKIKSDIQRVAQRLLFEQNDTATRNRFITSATEILQGIKVGQGIEDFRVIMDNTNNTEEDVDNNRLNGTIIVVPTRAVEYIAMDFVITNSGVEFPA